MFPVNIMAIRNSLSLCVFLISTCFLTDVVTREAIVGGRKVDGHAYGYQVSVHVHGHGYVCGGGIIDDRFILTAAHCVVDEHRQLRSTHISILAGTNSLNKADPPAVTMGVKKVFFPSEYHPLIEFTHGDIAVLLLVSSLELKHHVNLWELKLSPQQHPNTKVAIAGFGSQTYHKFGDKETGSSDDYLRQAMGNILSDERCEKAYPRGALELNKYLCAAMVPPPNYFSNGGRYGVCRGDTGSPLVEHGIHGTTVIGILSRISPLCDEKPPAVYTRIIPYLGMIHNVMNHDRDPDMITLHTELDL